MKIRPKTFIKVLFIAAFVPLVSLNSCREKEEKKEEQTVTKQETTEMSNTEKWQVLTNSNTNNSTNNANTAIAKNPAHGQPGHRCDIPVGAPLNSPPTNTATPVNSGNNANTGSVKVNPPHGQPGHRCDIKVGDPLPL